MIRSQVVRKDCGQSSLPFSTASPDHGFRARSSFALLRRAPRVHDWIPIHDDLSACRRQMVAQSTYRSAGPGGPPVDLHRYRCKAVETRPSWLSFAEKMVEALNEDTSETGYAAIVDLTRRLNSRYATARETQLATILILQSLFPSWLPGAFKVMFSGPMPQLSCKMNALVTALTCQWLMGPCTLNSVQLADGREAPFQECS
eukprot:jgi/Botrbrau1/997/Bobra.114_1s0035.1